MFNIHNLLTGLPLFGKRMWAHAANSIQELGVFGQSHRSIQSPLTPCLVQGDSDVRRIRGFKTESDASPLSLSPSLLPKKTALKKRRGKKTSAILRQFCRIRADSFSSDASFFHAVFNPHISLDGRLITLTDHKAFRFSRQQSPSANVKRKKLSKTNEASSKQGIEWNNFSGVRMQRPTRAEKAANSLCRLT